MFVARPGLCTSICTTLGDAVDHAPVRDTTERTAPVVDVPERVGDRRGLFYLLTRERQRMTHEHRASVDEVAMTEVVMTKAAMMPAAAATPGRRRSARLR